MRNLLSSSPIIAVITLADCKYAVNIADSLIAGGINTLEIVLRTEAALQSIEKIAHKFPDAIVGAGTVISSLQIEQCQQAGAKFLVSPGANDHIIEAAQAAKLPIMPGIATPSEILRVLEHGIDVMKLFPASVVGGLGALKAYGAVFSDVKFCPTGGINLQNLAEYHALNNVISVGGSWLVPVNLVEAKDWQGITKLAKHSLALLK